MSESKNEDSENVYRQIKLLSNRKKFQIIKAVEKGKKNITELSKEVGLAYNKCSNYISELEKEKLVFKVHEGKEVYVTSNIELKKLRLKKDTKR